MKILFVTGSYPPMKCGVGEYTAALAGAIANHSGVSVAVLTDVAAAAGKRVPGVDLLPVADGWRLRDALPIVKAIRRFAPDIVHIQSPTQGYSGAFLPEFLPMLGRVAGALVVQTRHEHMTRPGILFLANAFFTRKIVVVRPDFTKLMSPLYRWLAETREFRFIQNASAIPAVRLSEAERMAVASRYCPEGKQLVVHFGFAAIHKGVDRIFLVANPERDHIVLACDLSEADSYHRTILELAEKSPWKGNVTVTGFLPSEELAPLLAASDAVVFPFRSGSGVWNSSIHAAMAQGSFVLATSTETRGYSPGQNTYFALPENIEEMREALRDHIGHRVEPASTASGWAEIAMAHIDLYRGIMKPSPVPG